MYVLYTCIYLYIYIYYIYIYICVCVCVCVCIETIDILYCFSKDDAELVVEFVDNQGLDALVSVARDADATFQQYILKGKLSIHPFTHPSVHSSIHSSIHLSILSSTHPFLYPLSAVGEIVVYVDGMQGLIKCNEMIQWLYQLTASRVSYIYH